MSDSKSFKSVVEILQAMTESSMLKPGQRQDIKKVLRSFRKSLRTSNHPGVMKAVDEVARIVVATIRNQDN